MSAVFFSLFLPLHSSYFNLDMHNKVDVFNRARNIVIKDSSLVVNADTSKPRNLDRLFDAVAPNAILNASGRADEVRCYPGTREEVIGKIEKWMNGEGARQSRMMWLSGPAGAGKSAIFQTVAERCQERGTHAANFFFFRGDETRNHAQPLVATLAYQLLEVYPALNELLTDCLAAKPLICKAPVAVQFVQLISAPIQILQHSSSLHRPIILIIDGLDECDDKRKQELVLVALRTLVADDDSQFLVLVASRPEPHLVTYFNQLGTLMESIFLDSEYRPEDDIRQFVIAKFDAIKRTHHLAHTLDKNWPAHADIDAIICKSSGQFIYAATVMRFIQYSPGSPALSLLTVHDIRPSLDHNPLAQLDAVYSYIFSAAQEKQAVRLILGVHFLVVRGFKWAINFWPRFQFILHHLGYEPIMVESCFADLTAIVKFTTDFGESKKLVFYHASLPDYLLEKSRSGIHYVDVESIAAELALVCLKKLPDDRSSVSWALGVGMLEHIPEATPELSKYLLDASDQKLCEGDGSILVTDVWDMLIWCISAQYFGSDPTLYKLMLRRWIRFAYINNFGRSLLETRLPTRRIRLDIYAYFYWCLATEGLRFALKRPVT